MLKDFKNNDLIWMSQIHWFLILSVIVKKFTVTKSSVVEIQNLVVNPKSRPVKLNSEQYQFLLKYVSSKNQPQNFSK